MAQALVNAQHQVNLAALPSFSDNVKEDKYTAAQWLQKALLCRQAAAWTDDQIITHARNALNKKTCVKMMIEEVLKINVIVSKRTPRPICIV